MALGNNYYTKDNNDKVYFPTVYGIKFANGDSKIDATAIKFDFWKGMMKISIAPKKPSNGSEEYASFDFENAGYIYINHTKAMILMNEIAAMRADKDNIHSVGVNSGAEGFLMISDGKEFNSKNYCICIKKIDQNTGKTNSTYVYEIKSDLYHGIRNFNEETDPVQFTSYDYSEIELDLFVSILGEYVKASSNAIAASVITSSVYDPMKRTINSIAESLGVKVAGSGNKDYSGNRSNFFNNATSSAYNRTTTSNSYGESKFNSGNTNYDNNSDSMEDFAKE